MQGTEGIVACMAKWMSQKYSEKVLEDQIKLNFLSPDSPTDETKRILTESPEEPDNENFVEENNNDLDFHWCISSPSHPYYSLPSPKSPTSSWDSYDAISGPPTPPSPARSIESVHSVPDYEPSTPPRVQAKTFLGANLKIRSDLFSAKREINFKPDKNVDNFNDYNPVSAPPIVQLPKPVRNAGNITTVTLDEDGDSPEIISLSDDEDDDIREIFDESNIFTKFRPIENEEFVSKDEEENKDLNDPGWDTVRNLKDDHERRQFAISSFGNIEPADPTKNMSYHGYLRQQLRIQQGISDEENPKADEYIGEGLKIRNGVTEQIEKCDDDSFVEDLEETKIQIEETSRKRKAVNEHEDAPQAKRQMIEIGVYKRKLEHLAVKFKKKQVRPQDLKYYMRHWRLGANESLEFLHYYREDTNNNLVNVEELRKTECIEMLIAQFMNFYQVRERELCKECSYQEDKDVYHAM